MKKVSRVLVMAVCLSMAIMMSGCTASPEKTAERFLDAVRSLDATEAAKYVLDADNSDLVDRFSPERLERAKFLKPVFGRITYQLQKPSVSSGVATVPVRITCVDVPRVMGGVATQAISAAFASSFGGESQDMDIYVEQLLVNAVNDPSAPMTTVDTVLPLRKVHGRWLLAFDDESADAFLNAVTGNLGKALDL